METFPKANQNDIQFEIVQKLLLLFGISWIFSTNQEKYTQVTLDTTLITLL